MRLQRPSRVYQENALVAIHLLPLWLRQGQHRRDFIIRTQVGDLAQNVRPLRRGSGGCVFARPARRR